MGFYWSYTLLLKPPILVRFWLRVQQIAAVLIYSTEFHKNSAPQERIHANYVHDCSVTTPTLCTSQEHSFLETPWNVEQKAGVFSHMSMAYLANGQSKKALFCLFS